jgi:bifunctional DNA-binding transcriptional regulator/antitoxin component of YhaV-PrlF toxin-antitoxin module
MSYADISVEPAKMSTRGQIVIPQAVREKVKAGKDALFMVGAVDEDTIVLRKVDRQKIVSELLGMRKNIIQTTGGLTSKDIEDEIHAYRAGK